MTSFTQADTAFELCLACDIVISVELVSLTLARAEDLSTGFALVASIVVTLLTHMVPSGWSHNRAWC